MTDPEPGRSPDDHRQLLAAFAAGRRPALARAISIVENQRPGFQALMTALHPRMGGAHRVGLTGPPGAGKSTLLSALVQHYRTQDQTVAIVAVDPTSPFTGGALLGDRIRMNDLALDRGVFIRSMATRGSLGGLALTTREVADVMDAFGFDRLFIETVGVGQSELDVAAAADTTVVTLVPESGDSIQAMKAGLMEASDIFVINKADRPGADRMAREISQMLHMREGRALRNVPAHHGVDLKAAARAAEPQRPVPADELATWRIPVLQTAAHEGRGVPELALALDDHRRWLEETGERQQRLLRRVAQRVRDAVDRSARRTIWSTRGGDAILASALPALRAGDVSPYEVAARIISATLEPDGRERIASQGAG